MTRREKIILAATGVVAVLGLGSLFVGNGPAPAPPGVATGQAGGPGAAQVTGMLQAIQAATPAKTEEALLVAIARPWPAGALYDKPLESKAVAAKPAALPRYMGYVELGSGRLAVVDGFEYQVGDSLEGGGYKVVEISPDRVTLESLASGNRVSVPYEGQEALAR